MFYEKVNVSPEHSKIIATKQSKSILLHFFNSLQSQSEINGDNFKQLLDKIHL